MREVSADDTEWMNGMAVLGKGLICAVIARPRAFGLAGRCNVA